MTQRPLDILLFGATGFTGKLVAEYLAETCGARLRWAIAGRNADKLEEVRRDLARIEPALADMELHVVDTQDRARLDAIVPKARVVATTIGPFARYGAELVAACAHHGTHYCDITGEVTFVRRSIDTNDTAAKASRARIVHACGYDSIPFDLGVHMLWEHARERDRELVWVKGFAGKTRGAVSGGTVASALLMMEEATRSADARRLMTNTHALDPEPSAAAGSERDRRGVAFDRDIGRWTAPFVMSVINTRIVRRSHALLHYGEGFRYDEAMSMPRGPKGLALASLVTAGIAGFAVATALPKPRDFIQNSRFARSGTGPSREQREDGYFEARFVGETTAGSASSSRLRLEGVVEGKGDPGYASTARMLGEAALCLARDGSSLPPRYGVLTPASAMGMTLVHRLRNAGFTYRVSSSAST